MNLKKTASILSASILLLSPSLGTSAFAADSATIVKTISTSFNKNDVNGQVLVNIPDKTSVTIDIKAITPENPSLPYYTGTFKASDSTAYSFDIEGNDDRTYAVNIVIKDETLNLVSQKFSDTISMPDGDMTPNSYTKYNYVLSLENKENDTPFKVTSTEKTENGIKIITKNVVVYLSENYVKGDVNDDGLINAVDASLVLTDYAKTAIGETSGFTAKQKKAADVNENETIDAVDASKILSYYADSSTGRVPSWD